MEERRDAVISSLVKYLGPEASTYIHYREKVCGEFQPICSLSQRLYSHCLAKPSDSALFRSTIFSLIFLIQPPFWCTWAVQENSAEANRKNYEKYFVENRPRKALDFYFRSFWEHLCVCGGLSHAFASVLLIIFYCGAIIHFKKKYAFLINGNLFFAKLRPLW